MLICLIGLDGSGKTTLSMKILSMFDKYGIKSKYVWVKFGATILNTSKLRKKIKYDEHKAQLKKDNPFEFPYASKILLYMYLIYLLLDHWLQIIFKVSIPLLFGRAVVCDRYYHDTIVDIVVNLGIEYKKAKAIVRYLLPGIPEPDIAYYIEVPEKISYQRKTENYGIVYLKKKKEMYSKIKRDFKINTLNGTLDLRTLENIVSKDISKLIQRRGECIA